MRKRIEIKKKNENDDFMIYSFIYTNNNLYDVDFLLVFLCQRITACESNRSRKWEKKKNLKKIESVWFKK